MPSILPKDIKISNRFFTNIQTFILSFACGIGVYFLQAEFSKYSFWHLSGLLLICFIALWIKYLRLFAFLLAGFFYVWLAVDSYLSTRLDASYSSQDLELTGIVRGIPAIDTRRTSFYLAVQKARLKGKNLPLKKVRLSWYGKYQSLQPGQIVSLSARLKKPRGFKNIAGFDYARWLFQARIDATGYVKAKKPVQVLGQSTAFINRLHTLRYSLKQKVKQNVRNNDLSALFAALIIGDKTELSDKQWQVLQATGTSHLLAISGLHLGLVAAGIFYFLSYTLSFIKIDRLRLNILKIASAGSLMASGSYALLAGLSIPTQRAFIMLAVGLGLLIIKHKTGMFVGLLWAMLACLIFDPFAIIAAGFWLSFAAVFWIMVLLKFYGSKNKFIVLVKIQLVLALGLWPILNIFSLPVSSVSLPANLIILPVISLIGLPLLLVATSFLFLSPDIAGVLFIWAEFVFSQSWRILEYLASFNSFVLSLPGRSLLSPALFFLGLFLLLMPRGLPGKYAGILLIGMLLFINNDSLEKATVRISMLDVGQGQAIIIQTKNHTMLYDIGPKYGSGSSAFTRVVKPVLRKMNETQLDKVVLSHFDSDHAGGVEDVVSEFKEAAILAPYEKPELKNGLCYAGQKWLWDDVEFEILHPEKNTRFSGNNASCVLKITSGKSSILLSGDIEAEAEKALEKRNSDIYSKVLLLGHHGSKTSSTEIFLNKVNPDYALVSAAYNNKHKFPHKVVVQRLKRRDIKLFNTAHDGALEILLTKDNIKITGLRTKSPRLWD